MEDMLRLPLRYRSFLSGVTSPVNLYAIESLLGGDQLRKSGRYSGSLSRGCYSRNCGRQRNWSV